MFSILLSIGQTKHLQLIRFVKGQRSLLDHHGENFVENIGGGPAAENIICQQDIYHGRGINAYSERETYMVVSSALVS